MLAKVSGGFSRDFGKPRCSCRGHATRAASGSPVSARPSHGFQCRLDLAKRCSTRAAAPAARTSVVSGKRAISSRNAASASALRPIRARTSSRVEDSVATGCALLGHPLLARLTLSASSSSSPRSNAGQHQQPGTRGRCLDPSASRARPLSIAAIWPCGEDQMRFVGIELHRALRIELGRRRHRYRDRAAMSIATESTTAAIA